MGYADFNLTSSIFVPGSILLSPNSLWILWISQSQGDWWVSWYLPLLLRIHKKSGWDYRNKIQTREKNTLFTDPSLHSIFIATHWDFEWMMCGCVRSINRLVHKVINHYFDVWIHKHIHIEFWNNLLESCSRWSIWIFTPTMAELWKSCGNDKCDKFDYFLSIISHRSDCWRVKLQTRKSFSHEILQITFDTIEKVLSGINWIDHFASPSLTLSISISNGVTCRMASAIRFIFTWCQRMQIFIDFTFIYHQKLCVHKATARNMVVAMPGPGSLPTTQISEYWLHYKFEELKMNMSSSCHVARREWCGWRDVEGKMDIIDVICVDVLFGNVIQLHKMFHHMQARKHTHTPYINQVTFLNM